MSDMLEDADEINEIMGRQYGSAQQRHTARCRAGLVCPLPLTAPALLSLAALSAQCARGPGRG